MRSILLSLHSNWIYKIAAKQKTIEVRKVKPKLKTPFKCYIYCTNNCDQLYSVNGVIQSPKEIVVDLTQPSRIRLLNGRVVGEFVCDHIDRLLCYRESVEFGDDWHYYRELPGSAQQVVSLSLFDYLNTTGLTEHELGVYGDEKPLYGWHISDLVIYPEPKQLSDFVQGRNRIYCPENCEYLNWSNPHLQCMRKVTRPPQSFIYVEELHENT